MTSVSAASHPFSCNLLSLILLFFLSLFSLSFLCVHDKNIGVLGLTEHSPKSLSFFLMSILIVSPLILSFQLPHPNHHPLYGNRYQSKTIMNSKYLSYGTPLCPVIVTTPDALSAKKWTGKLLRERHSQEIKSGFSGLGVAKKPFSF